LDKRGRAAGRLLGINDSVEHRIGFLRLLHKEGNHGLALLMRKFANEGFQ
jgi:hypothetical protein